MSQPQPAAAAAPVAAAAAPSAAPSAAATTPHLQAEHHELHHQPQHQPHSSHNNATTPAAKPKQPQLTPEQERAARLAAEYAKRPTIPAVDTAGIQTGFDGSRTFRGHDSGAVADAIVAYVQQQQDAAKHSGIKAAWTVPREVRLAITPNAAHGSGTEWALGREAWSSFGLRAAYTIPPNADGSYTIAGQVFTQAPFSLAETVQSLYWAQVIFCIVWICTGVLLTFNGFAAFTWLSRAGQRERSAILSNGKKVHSKRAWLAGGIGGAVTGFLFVGSLVTIIMCAVCARGRAPLSPQAYFALWLAPSLAIGAGLGGHFKVAGRTFAGLLAGTCMTLMLTAVFGVHTLTVRVILLSIFCSLFTAPLLLLTPVRSGINVGGHATVQRHLLNICTSLIGMVLFLCGVALFAPPEDSSAAWIDLWVLLFAPDNSASQAAAVSAWGTPAFKGYIAGAVLGAVIGTVFEFFVHAKAGMDAQEEWNDYLGGYTERFHHQASSHNIGGGGGFDAQQPRAGMFEPAPTGWQRFADFFLEKDSRPASYAHTTPASNHAGAADGFTEYNRARRAKSSRSRKASGGPARFQAVAKGEKDADLADENELREESDGEGGDDDDADSQATDVDSNAGDEKTKKGGGANESADGTPAPLENYRGCALPRPPSYRTDSGTTASGGAGSGLSGSTKASSADGGAATTPTDEVHKPLGVYKDASSSPAPATTAAATASPTTAAASGAQTMVPATPSLINAITRIQQAQAQAKAWQQQSAGAGAAPYGATPRSPEPGASSANNAPGSPSSAAAAAGKPAFERWWQEEVIKGNKK